MDNQFTTLIKSYHDNYLQYKVSGSQTDQNAYLAAQKGIESILSSLQQQVTAQTAKISNFYKSDTEEKLRQTQSDLRKAEKTIKHGQDELEAAKMRTDLPQTSPPAQMPMMWQYITLATLGVVSLGLMALQ